MEKIEGLWFFWTLKAKPIDNFTPNTTSILGVGP